jgi:RsiW-degrading membrane proteinase PrsW (M82 family)
MPARWMVLAPLLALCGGIFGILGAAFNEALHGSLLLAFVGAPVFEEILKPSGVYFLLAKYPRVVRNRLYTAFLSALGGAAFATIENIIYLNIYFPHPTPEMVIWRYAVCTGLHTVCSFIFGFGINQRLLASVFGETKFLGYGKRFFLTAIVLHSLYNIAAVVFESRITDYLR